MNLDEIYKQCRERMDKTLEPAAVAARVLEAAGRIGRRLEGPA